MKADKQKLNDDEWDELSQLIDMAIANFLEFRETEGKTLGNDLTLRISNIDKLLSEVPKYEQERLDTVKLRIQKNLKEIIEDEKIDKNRCKSINDNTKCAIQLSKMQK